MSAAMTMPWYCLRAITAPCATNLLSPATVTCHHAAAGRKGFFARLFSCSCLAVDDKMVAPEAEAGSKEIEHGDSKTKINNDIAAKTEVSNLGGPGKVVEDDVANPAAADQTNKDKK